MFEASTPHLLQRFEASLPVDRVRPGRAVGIGFVGALVAAVVRLPLEPFLEGSIVFVTFFPAVFIAAMLGGSVAGAACLIASLLIAWFFYVPPILSFRVLSIREAVSFAAFAGSGSIIAAFAGLARRALREQDRSRRRFESLLRAGTAIVYRVDIHGRLSGPAQSWNAFTGQTPEEQANDGWVEMVHPEDRQRVAEAWRAGRARSQTSTVEARVWHAASREWRWMLAQTVPIFNREGDLVEWVGAASDIHDRKQADELDRMMRAELDHRVRNLAGVIQAIASRTARSAGSLEEFQPRFTRRLRALADAHALLTRDSWKGTTVVDLSAAALRPFRDEADDRITTAGPAVHLNPNSAVSLALALHELGTNATKYGALSTPAGRVEVRWTFHRESRRFTFRWTERGGPPAGPPSRRGFGSELIEQCLAQEADREVRLSYEPEGFELDLACTLKPQQPAVTAWASVPPPSRIAQPGG